MRVTSNSHRGLYTSLLEEAILPLGDAILHTDFMGHLKRWRRIQWLTRRQLRELQARNLSTVLASAVGGIEYYRRLGIKLTGQADDDLTQFPIIGKPTIKAQPDAFVNGSRSRLVCEKSSGSSGIQGAVYMTKRELSECQAIQTLWWEWAGFRLGEKYFQRGMTLDG